MACMGGGDFLCISFLVGIQTFVRYRYFVGLTVDIGPLVTSMEHTITMFYLYI